MAALLVCTTAAGIEVQAGDDRVLLPWEWVDEHRPIPAVPTPEVVHPFQRVALDDDGTDTIAIPV